MNRRIRTSAMILAIVQVACGGGSTSPPPPNVLAVAGTYPTRATVIADRNTCGSVTVQDNPTTVTHAPGATNLSLAHAGSTYTGSVDTSGRFSTPAADFAFPDADYTIALGGQFSTTGFTATVELTRRSGATTCTYAVGWVGTKQGAPNTIPGS